MVQRDDRHLHRLQHLFPTDNLKVSYFLAHISNTNEITAEWLNNNKGKTTMNEEGELVRVATTWKAVYTNFQDSFIDKNQAKNNVCQIVQILPEPNPVQ